MTKTTPIKQLITNHAEGLFTNADIGIAIIKTDGSFECFNPFFQQLFGFTKSELALLNIGSLFPLINNKDNQHSWEQHFNNANTGNKEENIELIALKKDGALFRAEVRMGRYTVENDIFTALFISDITKRQKEKEELSENNQLLTLANENRNKELRRTANILEMVNERLETAIAEQKAILDNVGIMLFVMNKRGVIKYFNPESTYLTGYTNQEVVNHFTPVLFMDPSGIQRCRDNFFDEFGLMLTSDFDVIKEHADMGQIHQMECDYRRKDGTIIPVSLSITPIKDKNKETTGYLGVAMDISEQKQVEIHLKEALLQERKLGEMKSRFVSLASHEFRTPLSTINSSAFLAKKYSAVEQQKSREKHLDRIISSVGLLTNILNDFLSVSKIEEGKMPVNYQHLDIKKETQQVIQALHSSKKTGQTIEYNHKGDHLVFLDGNIYNNILNNLLSNAIKFSKTNGKILVTTCVEKDQIKIQVKDDGIGISKEDQKHLMERFYRGANATHIQGTGLGLHIVSKYVERLKGNVIWESSENCGTTFIITFLRIYENQIQ